MTKVRFRTQNLRRRTSNSMNSQLGLSYIIIRMYLQTFYIHYIYIYVPVHAPLNCCRYALFAMCEVGQCKYTYTHIHNTLGGWHGTHTVFLTAVTCSIQPSVQLWCNDNTCSIQLSVQLQHNHNTCSVQPSVQLWRDGNTCSTQL